MKRKKPWKTVLIVLLSAAVLAGGTVGVLQVRKNSAGGVNVYPVSSFTTSADWVDTSETDGLVSTDRVQSVYLSSTQQVTEIYVEEGQEVHEGDPILAFDTTLSELELEKQDIKIRQLELDITNAEKNLKEIDTYRVGSPAVYTPVYTTVTHDPAPWMPYNRTPQGTGTASDPLVWLWNDDCVLDESFFLLAAVTAAENRSAVQPDPTEDPEPTEEPEETEEPEPTEAPEETTVPEETERPAETAVPEESAAPVQPEESTAPETPEPPQEDPDPQPAQADEPEQQQAEDPAAPVPEEEEEEEETDESAAAPLPVSRLLSFPHGHGRLLAEEDILPDDPEPAEDPYLYLVFEVRSEDSPDGDLERVWEMVLWIDEETMSWSARFIAPSYDPGDSGDSGSYYDYSIDTNVYYTAAEISQMKAEANQKLKDLKIELKSAQLEYERLEYELSNGEVLSRIDGVVKTVRTPDEAKNENRPVVMISGGGGYYVTAVLGELDLGTMHVGDPVTVTNWETYETLEGTITEISEYPDESGQYWFYSQGNQNVSQYPFTVFIDGDAELRDGGFVSVSYSSTTEGGGLYLQTPFVRQESGRSWVYVAGDDGVLHERTVRTGKNLWGSYVQILSGLSEDEYIAFPYGRQTTEGAKTTIASAEELWSSSYGYGMG